jgi:hypothetical protein
MAENVNGLASNIESIVKSMDIEAAHLYGGDILKNVEALIRFARIAEEMHADAKAERVWVGTKFFDDDLIKDMKELTKAMNRMIDCADADDSIIKTKEKQDNE